MSRTKDRYFEEYRVTGDEDLKEITSMPIFDEPDSYYGALDDDQQLNVTTLEYEEFEKKQRSFLINGKQPMNFAPMEMLQIFSKMCMAGLNKGYEPHSWLTNVSTTQHLDALKRHIRDYERGVDMDYDGFLNLEAILWRATAACLVDYFKMNPQEEDRWLAKALAKRMGDGYL